MGQRGSNFTKEELEEYEELTYLNRSEVLQAFKKYRDIDPPRVKSCISRYFIRTTSTFIYRGIDFSGLSLRYTLSLFYKQRL